MGCCTSKKQTKLQEKNKPIQKQRTDESVELDNSGGADNNNNSMNPINRDRAYSARRRFQEMTGDTPNN